MNKKNFYFSFKCKLTYFHYILKQCVLKQKDMVVSLYAIFVIIIN